MVSDDFQLFSALFQLFSSSCPAFIAKNDYFSTMKTHILAENQRKTWWDMKLVIGLVLWSISIIFRCFSASFWPFSAIFRAQIGKKSKKTRKFPQSKYISIYFLRLSPIARTMKKSGILQNFRLRRCFPRRVAIQMCRHPGVPPIFNQFVIV